MSTGISDEYFDVFKQNYLVAGLSDDDIRRVGEIATVRKEAANGILIREGQNSSDLYVVLNGRLVIQDSNQEKLADAEPGAVVGEVALVDAHPRSADVISPGLTTLAVFPADKLRGFMGQNREIGFVMLANLSRVLSMRLRRTTDAIEALRGETADPWEKAF